MRLGRDHRLLVITGKGGVGRSVVTAALGLACAQDNIKTTTVEFDGLSSLAQLHGLTDRAFEPRTVGPQLDTMSLTVMECLGDFGRRVLKIGALVRVVFQNRIVRALVDGVPGIHDLLQLGKLRNLLAEPLARDRKYDLAILDAPATGHGLTLLDSGKTMAELTRVGPLYDEARQIEDWLGNPDLTGIIVVTLAERLPVQEALQLIDKLDSKQGQLVGVVLNKTVAETHATDVDDALADAIVAAERPDLLALLHRQNAIRTRQADAMATLRAGLQQRGLDHVPSITLPKVSSALQPQHLVELAQHLEAHNG